MLIGLKKESKKLKQKGSKKLSMLEFAKASADSEGLLLYITNN